MLSYYLNRVKVSLGYRLGVSNLWKTNKKNHHYDATGQNASDIIKEKLLAKDPCMIARFGGNELCTVVNYLFVEYKEKHKFKSVLRYIKDPEFVWGWDNLGRGRDIYEGAGVFPKNTAILKQFSQLMMEDIPQVDILGSWMCAESYFEKELSLTKKIPLSNLEPYLHVHPWSEALKGKKVLVIHPFSETIKKQYLQREKLFDNQNILPHFELITYKAVQSGANNPSSFKDWIEALNYMKEAISKIEFDIAIIGCGAYGFPLAAHVKRLGKKSVHLGGATQLLFGIKGKRWEQMGNNYNGLYKSMLSNPFWVRPSLEETPTQAIKIEGATYW